ncbi:hypothetical protein OE09_1220 [Flavobacteriaceae bacterium MAR_2010_72]|nr:hypothetical protein OE09_1220 [Flavobacteriaceae bacterium MAR_2010_72]
MQNLNELIIFEHPNEHVFEHELEHNLTKKRNFSMPKIYNANGDLSQRWHVYFAYRNPDNGKLIRMNNIYGIANRYKTKEDRLFILSVYRRRLIKLLNEGYNPFKDNTELFESKMASNLASDQKPEPKATLVKKFIPKIEENFEKVEEQKGVETPKMTVKEAFDLALNLKKNVIGIRTYKDYESRSNKFMSWISEHHKEVTAIEQVDKKLIMLFLNDMLTNNSSRSFNNYRTDLRSLMQTMEDNEIIESNPVKNIKAQKTNPQRNKTYSLDRQTEIFNYLEKEDPIMLLYIKFISYNFLRPIEVCRLKIKDINIKEKTIQFKAKNSPLKTKRIPDLLLDELPDLSNLDGEFYLFTPDKIGGTWDATEINRRDHFSKRYKDVVKNHFKIGKNYGLYSFRHTFITKLYRAMVKESSPFAAKSKLMLITGHSTMDALNKYLRDIDAEIPEDYSNLLK